MSYRVYMSDSIKLYCEGKGMTTRWIDIVDGVLRSEPATKSDDEDMDYILRHVVERGGLEVTIHELDGPCGRD